MISEVIWRLHHILMVILFLLAIYRITISHKMIKESLRLVVILPITVIIFFANAIGRPSEFNELEWLWIELTEVAIWAIFVVLGYIYTFYYAIKLIKKVSNKNNYHNENEIN